MRGQKSRRKSRRLPEPMSVPGPLEAYRTLLDLTRQMLDAAHREDIDLLTRLEAGRVECIRALPGSPETLAAGLRPAEAEALRQTLRDIQACDAEVLAYLQPWRTHLGNFLKRLS